MVRIPVKDRQTIPLLVSDPYENIYTVVRGSKHFTLLPPTEGGLYLKGQTVSRGDCGVAQYFAERMYPHGTWTRSIPDGLTMISSPNVSPIRWSSVNDPDLQGNLPPEAHPIRITVEAGETLYLPPGWWHHVRQADNTIALNWWYDMEMRGMSWVVLSLLRGVGDVPSGNEEDAQES